MIPMPAKFPPLLKINWKLFRIYFQFFMRQVILDLLNHFALNSKILRNNLAVIENRARVSIKVLYCRV